VSVLDGGGGVEQFLRPIPASDTLFAVMTGSCAATRFDECPNRETLAEGFNVRVGY
jgi:hypothetical protein